MNSDLENYLKLIAGSKEQWDVTRIAFEIGKIVRPRGDFSTHYEYLQQLEQRVRALAEGTGDVYARVEAVNQVLFQEERFVGNREKYEDPLNSFLPAVIMSRRGIPITLCILYRELGSRVGLELDWVGMPGHFLLGLKTPVRRVFLDAFNGGQLLVDQECFVLMRNVMGSSFPERLEYLAPVSPRTVILRLLLNLKQIYRQTENDRLLLEIIERRIPLVDDPVTETLERGLAKVNLDNLKEGLADIEFFLRHSKNDEVRKLVEDQLEQIRRLAQGN